MKPYVTIAVIVLLTFVVRKTAECAEYQPQLFKNIKLIYDEPFDADGPHNDPDHWTIRQNTNWREADGVLTGGLADVDYQKMMQAKNDGHDGTRTVIFLKPVPKAFVVRMRVRYTDTEKKGRDRGSLLDLGHHVNSFIFREDGAVLTLQKKKKIKLPKQFFPLNQWNEVTIEIKEGALLIRVNDKTQIIKDPLITLKSDQESQQIDFKGQDFGTVQIDWIKLYQGIE